MLVLAVGVVVALVLWTRRRNMLDRELGIVGLSLAIVAIGALLSLAVYFWPQALTW